MNGGKLSDGKSVDMLIDFNSPLQRQIINPKCQAPLLPAPSTSVDSSSSVFKTALDIENDSEVVNNPFDMAVHQTNINIRMLNDPFELVYQKAQSADKCSNSSFCSSSQLTVGTFQNERETPTNMKQNASLTKNYGDISNSFERKYFNSDCLSESHKWFDEPSKEYSLERSLIYLDDVSDPTGKLLLSLSDPLEASNSVFSKNNKEVVDFKRQDLISGTEAANIAGNSNSHTDEELKAIVASRISSCIQNAMEQSKLCNSSVLLKTLNTSDMKVVTTSRYVDMPYVGSLVNESLRACVNQKQTQFENEKSDFMNCGLTTLFKTPVSRFRMSTQSGSDCSSNGELNRGFMLPSRHSLSSNSPPERLHSKPNDILKFTSPSTNNRTELQDMHLGHQDFECKRSSSFCITSNLQDHGNRLSTTFLDSSDVVDNEKNGDDSVFLEAHCLASVFSKIADSFTQPNCSDGEEEEDDILSCKPQWEKSQLKLPKFNSEEDDTDGSDSKLKEGFTSSEESNGKDVHSTPQKKSSGISNNTSDEPSINISTSPLSEHKILGLALHSRTLLSPDSKLREPVSNVNNPPPSLKLIDDNLDKDLRFKPKKIQQVGKRGPMKAVIPLDNMTRGCGVENTGTQPQVAGLKSKTTKLTSNTSKNVVRSLHTNDMEMSTGSQKAKAPKTGQRKIPANHSSNTSVIKDRSLSSKTPTVQRANSFNNGIPSLVAPEVKLRLSSSIGSVNSSNVGAVPTTPVNKQPTRKIATLSSQRKSKSSSSIPQFNVSGTLFTSTPSRESRFASSPSSRYLPSPIAVRDSKAKLRSSNEISPCAKTENVYKYRSFESQQEKKIINNRQRAKSASKIQTPGKYTSDVVPLSNSQVDALKPLEVKNLTCQTGSKEFDKELPNSTPGRKWKKPFTAPFSALKRSLLSPVDKENVKPV